MDRIINVKVGGNHLTKDSNNAGTRGEANVTTLRITFDEGWDGYSKSVTFWDAHGLNPTRRTLTTDLLENITESTRIYLVPIPSEALGLAGELTFTIEGYCETKTVIGEGSSPDYDAESPVWLSVPLSKGTKVYYECHWKDGSEDVGEAVYDGSEVWYFSDSRLRYSKTDNAMYACFDDFPTGNCDVKFEKLSGKRQRCVSDTLEVKDALIADDPTEVTPDDIEQMQAQYESIMEDIRKAELYKNEALYYYEESEGYSNGAKLYAENALKSAQSAFQAKGDAEALVEIAETAADVATECQNTATEQANISSQSAQEAKQSATNAYVAEQNAKTFSEEASQSAENANKSEANAYAIAQEVNIAKGIIGDWATQTSENREQAEDCALRAENAVGKTSYIGENGNWFEWDSTKEAFYDTGVRAEAKVSNADYAQNDETQPDYIKNRPCYETIAVIGEGDRYPDDTPIKLTEPLQNGDIVYYECHWQDGTESIGSAVCEIDEYGGWTFCDGLVSYKTETSGNEEGIYHWYGDYEGDPSHIKISKLKPIPLPEKYLPDIPEDKLPETVAKKSDVPEVPSMHTVRFYEKDWTTEYHEITVPHNGQIVIPKHLVVGFINEYEDNGETYTQYIDKVIAAYFPHDEHAIEGGRDTEGELVTWLTNTGGVEDENDAYNVIGIVKGDCHIVVVELW